MQHRIPKYALIALFLGMLFIPSVVGLVAGGRVKTINQEKRALAELPGFSFEGLSELPGRYEAYYNDNQPFRDQLIFVRALLNKALYNTDVSDQVIFGKEGWLFYSDRDDGSPIEDYRGEDAFTSLELRQIAANLTRARDDLKRIGCDFVLFIAPNKERVYSEYMPDRFGAPAEDSAVVQLVRFLRQRTDIKVVYPREEIMAARDAFPDVPLYYADDTHWNDVGGYIGARALMRALGVELPGLTREMIQPAGYKGPGDLALLTHLDPILPRDQRYVVTVPQTVDAGDRKLYLRRDSFGEYMEGYLSPLFAEMTVNSTLRGDHAAVDAAQPDVFVMEVVERYLRLFMLNEPPYVAPGRRSST